MLHTSRDISRVVVLQSQDLLLPTLLDEAEAVVFALILEEFLWNLFVLSTVSNCIQ
jgi:hypothetical protein